MSILYIQDAEMTSATRMTSASQMPSTNKMTAVYGSGKQMSEMYIWGRVSGGDRGTAAGDAGDIVHYGHFVKASLRFPLRDWRSSGP